MHPMSIAMIGRMLRGIRAGDKHLSWNHPAIRSAPEILALTSTTFADGENLPPRCAGRPVGDDVSPALAWSGIPAAAEDLLLVMEDPDAPLPRPVVHMLVTSIDPTRSGFAEGALSEGVDPAIRFAVGTFSRRGYHGPRPVPGHGPHRYIFQLFALKRRLEFDRQTSIATILAAATDQVLARGRIVGLFER
jgi:hypothetical protein